MRISVGKLVLLPAAMVVLAAVMLLWDGSSVTLHRAQADVQGTPHLELDMDPTNGTRPCSPIDASATGPTSGSYQVAVCLEEGAGSPDAFEFHVNWSGGVATAPEVADAGDALSDNPDFNDGAAPNGFGTNWSCNSFGLAFPKADDPGTVGVTDAKIVCNEKSFAAGTMTAEPGLLALITMNASGSGTETFEIDGTSNFNSPGNINCATVTCPGGTVNQGGGATATNTPVVSTATPTSTPTPCTGECPTSTPPSTVVIGFITYTPTSTATSATGEATPPPPTGETPPGGGGQPTVGPGGGPGGVVRPPDTGTGGPAGASGTWIWVAMALAGCGSIVLATALYGARRRQTH